MIRINGNRGLCKHVDGGLLSVCFAASNSSIRNCATFCTRQSNCVGFVYGLRNGIYICGLYPTDDTCPNGFEYIPLDDNADTVSDLVAVASPSYVCYGKYLGT